MNSLAAEHAAVELKPGSDRSSHAEPQLRVEHLPRLDAIDQPTWDRLFRDHPDGLALAKLIASDGMDGVSASTLIIRNDHGPILVLPLFTARIDASSLIEGPAAPIARFLARVAPGPMHPRLLGIGFVEGEWGAAGFSADATPAHLDRAWSLAFDTIRTLAKSTRTKFLTLLDIEPSTLASIPPHLRRQFVPMDTDPCARLSLPFESVDAYLASLSRSTRQNIRRRLRNRNEIRIERTTSRAHHLDRIYELYARTVERAELKLGILRPSYFEHFCSRIPGAHIALYFKGNDLLAFNALVERPDILLDKYFCMEEDRGREHSLYYLSWLENVRYAIENKIPLYHAGAGAEETKKRLGCSFEPTETLFLHTNPFIHRAVAALARAVARRSSAKSQARASDESGTE